MEPLQCLFEIATEDGLLSPINNRVARMRCSLYAGDAALFNKPRREDFKWLMRSWDCLGEPQVWSLTETSVRPFQFGVLKWI